MGFCTVLCWFFRVRNPPGRENEKLLIGLIVIVLLSLTACRENKQMTAEHSEPVEAPQEQTVQDISVIIPKGKPEIWTFTGNWEDDNGTIFPIIAHLYEDWTLVLEAKENLAGSWSVNEDDTLALMIGENLYTAKYSDNLKTYFFPFQRSNSRRRCERSAYST